MAWLAAGSGLSKDWSGAIGFERYLNGCSVITAHRIGEHEHSLIGVSGRRNPLALISHEITCILRDLPSGSIKQRPRIPNTKGSAPLTLQLQSARFPLYRKEQRENRKLEDLGDI